MEIPQQDGGVEKQAVTRIASKILCVYSSTMREAKENKGERSVLTLFEHQ